MLKTVIVPTDFTIESLSVVKTILNNSEEDQKFNIILLSGALLNDSIMDLMFFSKNKYIKEISSPEFDDAYLIIKNKYESKINSFRKDIFTGFTQSAFDNYVEANKVEEAWLTNSSDGKADKATNHLLAFVKKSPLKILTVQSARSLNMPEKGRVAEVFYNDVTSR